MSDKDRTHDNVVPVHYLVTEMFNLLFFDNHQPFFIQHHSKIIQLYLVDIPYCFDKTYLRRQSVNRFVNA